MPVAQSLEFGYATGQTLTAKLFASGNDTVVATASSVTEATNRKGRYVAAFTDAPAADYLLVYFIGSSGVGYEYYRLTLATATFQPVVDLSIETKAQADARQAALIAAIGDGGVTAEEIVDEIENRGITTVAVQSGVTNATTLELVQGDTYDGIGKPLLAFTVTKDYTSGWTATLTIRDKDDAVVATHTGTVASATSITFSMTAPTGLTMVGVPGSWQGKFDVQLSKNSSRDTVTRGACYVYEDQTRS
jgi:hypothetical protein